VLSAPDGRPSVVRRGFSVGECRVQSTAVLLAVPESSLCDARGNRLSLDRLTSHWGNSRNALFEVRSRKPSGQTVLRRLRFGAGESLPPMRCGQPGRETILR